jgi:hypothetical protein
MKVLKGDELFEVPDGYVSKKLCQGSIKMLKSLYSHLEQIDLKIIYFSLVIHQKNVSNYVYHCTINNIHLSSSFLHEFCQVPSWILDILNHSIDPPHILQELDLVLLENPKFLKQSHAITPEQRNRLEILHQDPYFVVLIKLERYYIKIAKHCKRRHEVNCIKYVGFHLARLKRAQYEFLIIPTVLTSEYNKNMEDRKCSIRRIQDWISNRVEKLKLFLLENRYRMGNLKVYKRIVYWQGIENVLIGLHQRMVEPLEHVSSNLGRQGQILQTHPTLSFDKWYRILFPPKRLLAFPNKNQNVYELGRSIPQWNYLLTKWRNQVKRRIEEGNSKMVEGEILPKAFVQVLSTCFLNWIHHIQYFDSTFDSILESNPAMQYFAVSENILKRFMKPDDHWIDTVLSFCSQHLFLELNLPKRQLDVLCKDLPLMDHDALWKRMISRRNLYQWKSMEITPVDWRTCSISPLLHRSKIIYYFLSESIPSHPILLNFALVVIRNTPMEQLLNILYIKKCIGSSPFTLEFSFAFCGIPLLPYPLIKDEYLKTAWKYYESLKINPPESMISFQHGIKQLL